MAQRRMFSSRIVETDKFLDMPTSAQCLYFHLGMNGDDDGFVASPKRITAMCGCTNDDLRLLIQSHFVYPFESGICVITDWRINNTLRNDRYTPTIYAAEKALFDTLKHDGTILDTKWQPLGIPNGNHLETQHNITKHNITKHTSCAAEQRVSEEEFTAFWRAYPKKRGKKDARRAFDKAIKKTDLTTILDALEKNCRSEEWQRSGGQFIPYPSTWLNGERWADELMDTNATVYTLRPESTPTT